MGTECCTLPPLFSKIDSISHSLPSAIHSKEQKWKKGRRRSKDYQARGLPFCGTWDLLCSVPFILGLVEVVLFIVVGPPKFTNDVLPGWLAHFGDQEVCKPTLLVVEPLDGVRYIQIDLVINGLLSQTLFSFPLRLYSLHIDWDWDQERFGRLYKRDGRTLCRHFRCNQFLLSSV